MADVAEADGEAPPATGLRIACAAIDHVGTVVWQNAVPVIREITLTNDTGEDLAAVTLTLRAEPAFLRLATLRIDRIAAGGLHRIEALDLRIDGAVLGRLRESSRCSLTLVAEAAGGGDATREVGRETLELRLLPPAHWGGSESAPELLAAFVRPNDPAVDAVLGQAGRLLAAAGGAFDGYRSGRRARVWAMAEAIHAALAGLGLAYVLPPASFERLGQKVRSPSEIVERRVATCLDLTLFAAACFEQAGLNPILILTRGHACLGLWLVDEGLADAVGDDVQALRKRRDLDELVAIETTLLTSDPPGRFAQALAAGARHLDEGAEEPLDVALDLRRLRARGIRPLDAGEPGPAAPPAPVQAVPLALEGPPAFAEDRPAAVPEPPVEEPPRDRLETWKRRLLDLTLRNKLLNFKPGKAALTLDLGDAGARAERLADGRFLRFLARADAPEIGDREVQARLRDEALGRDEIATTSPPEELEARLTDLFRLSRNAFEEGGANVLFLALGFLTWTRGGSSPPARAPLLLVPVALTRTSVRSGFRLVRHDEEARLNPTLIEMLRQDFSLVMPEFEGGLPGDGLDVAAIWRIVRGHVRDLKGFEVTTEIVLSAFSFTKFLMWKDLSERTEILKRNAVVRHLLETPKETYGDGTGFPAPERLDAEHPPAGIYTPLSADSSQLSAILAAAAGKDFVLFGPPGTGKSQTIANMVAQCLALGRTVLFVSQKTAALDVVRRRLETVGLGACCLEVHSTRAQKSDVLAQLREAWAARSGGADLPWAEAGDDLARRRAELNGLVASLHHPRENGMSAYAALGRVVADQWRDGADRPAVTLSWPDHTAHAPETLAALRARVRALRTLLPIVGDVADHPLRGIGAVEWSPLWQSEMERAIGEVVDTLPALEASARALAALLGLDRATETDEGVRALSVLAAALLKPEARVGLRFCGPRGAALREAVAARQAFEDEARRLAARLSVPYAPTVFEGDLRRLQGEWREAKAANFLLRGSWLRRVRRMLEPDAEGPLPEDLGPDLATLIESKRLREAGPAFAGTLERAFADLPSPWRDASAPAATFAPAVTWAAKVGPAVAALAADLGPEALRARLAQLLDAQDGRLEPGGAIHAAQGDFARARTPALRAIEALGRLAGRARPERPLATGPGWVAGTLATARRWQSALPKAQAWASWQAAAAAARQAGLGPLVAAIEAGGLGVDAIEPAFESAYARWWSDHVVTHDPRLRSFLGQRHAEDIAAFRAADARMSDLAGAAVLDRIGGAIPRPDAFGSDPEWGTLAREITKRARHLPLRKLFARMPNALTRLTPCVMMSPLSIAQYWPAEARPFDVVIFDEASQIAPWDAIGAIARGRQVVIVGDPEQLPPTNVGDRGVDEIPDGLDVADQESILDECLAANLPRHRLSWHYRSRHESLIAFSNRHYYRGGLITFPSPVTEDRAVRLVPVPDGLYERGGARVNRPEARAVVAEIVARLSDPDFLNDKTSLGVVTFNGEQQRLIENLLDAERRANPALERFFDARTWHEPVFVKNLETVQGDERDTILFSVAVGPDAAGRITGQVS
ncbi:DUF4011 domain-containing protein [Methylobacterium iners]|uniref:ATP-dependent RecD-like DNA helicase n=1 Tax=Methylobacterium iners TaxID=418707 RepID=A0ABQ4S291_9HYPH|nr:DUF4011 domain-containing protein [Methylobacterium iners]GJD95820.1 ATP-dependent RecD-like DNA helicase [Methylobacterium iners]